MLSSIATIALAFAGGQTPEPICLTEEATYACCIPERHIRPEGPYDCADYLYLSEGDLDEFVEACMSMDFWSQSMTIIYVTETKTDCLHWDFRTPS